MKLKYGERGISIAQPVTINSYMQGTKAYTFNKCFRGGSEIALPKLLSPSPPEGLFPFSLSESPDIPIRFRGEAESGCQNSDIVHISNFTKYYNNSYD